MGFRLLILQLLFAFFLNAQVSEDKKPLSDFHSQINRPQLINVQAPSIQIIDNALKKPMLAAQLVNVDIDLITQSTKNIIENSTIYRTTIKSTGAKALNIYFNDFNLSTEDQLYIYSKDKQQLLGAFTAANNKKHKQFATDYIVGDEITIEYNHKNSTPLASLKINQIGYFLKDTEKETASQSCEVNINCSEGDDWQDEKKGIVRLLIRKGNQTFWCSGSLVNNTSTDCTPYILSADHCTNESSTSDFTTSIAYFNFESTTCEGTSNAFSNTMTGFELIANGPYTGGSDFVLLKLSGTIPDAYTPYFNGWKVDETTFSNGASIHHPAGDIKKISQFNSTLSSITLNGGLAAAYWKVNWTSSDNGHGITEEGSSGGPLFNNNGLIIGTLTGGNSFCTSPNEDDYFGKFSKHWSSNGSNSSKRLMDWLDPSNLGVTELKGTYRPCTNSVEKLAFKNQKIWPNPANNQINISFEHSTNISPTVEIIDILGQTTHIQTLTENTQFNIQIPISEIANGTYILKIYASGISSNQTLIIRR